MGEGPESKPLGMIRHLTVGLDEGDANIEGVRIVPGIPDCPPVHDEPLTAVSLDEAVPDPDARTLLSYQFPVARGQDQHTAGLQDGGHLP